MHYFFLILLFFFITIATKFPNAVYSIINCIDPLFKKKIQLLKGIRYTEKGSWSCSPELTS